MRKDRLPSHMSSVFLTVDITGTWRPRSNTPDDGDLAGLARHQLRERVRHALMPYSVLDVAAAQDAVNADITQ